MKNNKMKKIISITVAILFAFSALTVHASATQANLGWYEYTHSGTYGDFIYDDCDGWANGSSSIIYEAYTTSENPIISWVEAEVSWVTNVSPEFEPVYDYDTSSGGAASAYANGNGYIESDYEIYSSNSWHCVNLYDDSYDSFSIGTSY